MTETPANNTNDQKIAVKVSELLGTLSSRKDKGMQPDEFLSLSTVAAKLFEKAPEEFLSLKRLDDLVHITERATCCLSDLTKSADSDVIVSIESTSEFSALYVALRDHPFIVNTIHECLRRSRARTHSLLHPILPQGSHRVSLSYVEMDPINSEALTVLCEQVQSALRDLIPATDDFTGMVGKAETLAKIYENPRFVSSSPQEDRNEVARFLRWLTDGNFVFFGHAECRVDNEEVLSTDPASLLGLFKTRAPYRGDLFTECDEDRRNLLESSELITFTRLRVESPVHRFSRLNHVVVEELSLDGKITAVHSFIGLLTSKAFAQESSSLPLVKARVRKVISSEGALESSYDYKYIVDIVDGMPKEEVLRLSVSELKEIVRTILDIHDGADTRVSVRFDAERRGVSVLTVMPRERVNVNVREELQAYLEHIFKAQSGSSEYHVDLSPNPLAKFYFYTPLPANKDITPLDIARIRREVEALSRTWIVNVEERILRDVSRNNREVLWAKYSSAFTQDYQALHTAEEGIFDIDNIEKISNNDKTYIAFAEEFKDGCMTIVVYNLGEEISISKALPVLENAGFLVLSERSAKANLPTGVVYIHRFRAKEKGNKTIPSTRYRELLTPGLGAVFQGRAENDGLNALMASAGLNVRAVSLLRTYCRFCWQIQKSASRESIYEAFSEEPQLAAAFFKLFTIKFDPSLNKTLEARAAEVAELLEYFKEQLRAVKNLIRDKILRTLISLLEHTVRTNFYTGKSTIALKVSSQKIDVMPHPRPLYEIYLNSPVVEGVHLRAGSVARGGIRWSERPDDFRSEVLGLVKTQAIKNVVIIPTGAKGGFLVKDLPQDKAAQKKAVEDAYREFIRTLLSLTDNRKEDKVLHPEGVLCYDGEDPYFVVAADKGTATFSDIANQIAENDFQFWLGDAFASGGSNGYDHKRFGITARGAWECVKRHFNDLGINYAGDPFTVIGLGDMSGDVFGNGLLYSENIKLIGAFNHSHIFIDPSPDPKKSFAERKRLFETKGSQWSNYNSNLISQGGGVYDRFAKEIKLTREMRDALAVPPSAPSVLSGEELITHILRAPCDLLWNGGIGTYVKASSETHAQVEDSQNDGVRVDASELRARVVGEGGNLGFTQRARIEFASRGGSIFTDAIDNSGGVDLSDHEVNIKILFASLLRSGKVNRKERDKLLEDIAPEVIEAVLCHNRNHALMLTSGVTRSQRHIEYHRGLLRELVKLGYVHRGRDVLPEDDELLRRAQRKTGLVSPELAVTLAHVKKWLKDSVLSSRIVNDPLLHHLLLGYFPSYLRTHYKEEILAHPMAPNIIATEVSNMIVDLVGLTFVYRISRTYSVSIEEAIKCVVAAALITDANLIREVITKFDTYEKNREFLKMFQEMGRSLRDVVGRLISYHGANLTLHEIVALYKGPYRTFVEKAEDVLSGDDGSIVSARRQHYQTVGLNDFSARSLALSSRLIPVFDILWSARESGGEIPVTARVFSHVMDEIGLYSILSREQVIETTNRWDQDLFRHAFEDIRRGLAKLTVKFVIEKAFKRDQISELIERSPHCKQLRRTIEEFQDKIPGVAALAVLGRQLRGYELR